MLTVKNIGKKYSNGIWGIENFSINVSGGEIVCIAGPNGSGKTTVINCVLDVINLTTGEIHYDNIPVKSEKYKKNITYVSDETILIDALTGREYLDFISKMYDLKNRTKQKSLIDLFSMDGALNQVISTYSHGMKKKLQIISAFMLGSKIIVLDEPARGLDIESVISLKKLMRKFVTGGGAILLSTHDLISAENLCDRMCIIAGGKEITAGTPSELKTKWDGKDLEEVFMKSSLLSERGEKIEQIINDF
jgi:ABC-2 type transport system ATP-binding protein